MWFHRKHQLCATQNVSPSSFQWRCLASPFHPLVRRTWPWEPMRATQKLEPKAESLPSAYLLVSLTTEVPCEFITGVSAWKKCQWHVPSESVQSGVSFAKTSSTHAPSFVGAFSFFFFFNSFLFFKRRLRWAHSKIQILGTCLSLHRLLPSHPPEVISILAF